NAVASLSTIASVSRAVSRFKALLGHPPPALEQIPPRRALQSTPPFSYLAPRELDATAQLLSEVDFEAGAEIYATDARERTVYVLAQGQVVGVQDGKGRVFLSAPAVFGDFEALFEVPRQMTFHAAPAPGASLRSFFVVLFTFSNLLILHSLTFSLIYLLI